MEEGARAHKWHIGKKERQRVCVCVREGKRERERERERECVCVREREREEEEEEEESHRSKARAVLFVCFWLVVWLAGVVAKFRHCSSLAERTICVS